MSDVAPAGQVTTSSAQRIVISRERLRQAMTSGSTSRTASSQHDAASESSSAGLIHGLQDMLKSVPGASIFAEAIASWWAQHPLHAASVLAARGAQFMIKPMAQRNPWILMLSMAFIGGFLVWKRPWRLLLTPAFFVGLVPHVISRIAQQVPFDTWLSSTEPRQDPVQQQTSDSTRPTP